MSRLHKAGAAGLFMTLQQMSNRDISIEGLSWDCKKDRIELVLSGDIQTILDSLLRKAYSVDEKGLIHILAHEAHPMGLLEKIAYTEALRMTFLQHNKFNKIPKGTADREITYEQDEKTVSVTFKPFGEIFAHMEQAPKMVDKQGRLQTQVEIKGWLFPGASERHTNLTGTEIEEPPDRFLCLLFAPVACLFQTVVHRALDGKSDKRRRHAIIVPHVSNLFDYTKNFMHYLETPVERLVTDGPGDAALNALVTLRANEHLDALGVTGCSVYILGTVSWSSQQRTRTSVTAFENLPERAFGQYDYIVRALPNVTVFKPEKKSPLFSAFTVPSLARGLFADNIAQGREWFLGFCDLMKSGKLAKKLQFEKGGLNEMINKNVWNNEMDRALVQAIHEAIRRRYGALAGQAAKRGENIRFDREYERMRTSLSRTKNAATLRAEVTDLFARSGINPVLQEKWPELLPMIFADDWQRIRDLALFALASYKGKGVEMTETLEQELDEEVTA